MSDNEIAEKSAVLITENGERIVFTSCNIERKIHDLQIVQINDTELMVTVTSELIFK